MSLIHVAVGIVINPQQQILLSRRQAHQHQGNKWEYPGGKVENGEVVFAALQRELHEELAINIHSAEPWFCIEHDYGDKQVKLDLWVVRDFSGQPRGCEGQQVAWVNRQQLALLEFPAANQMITARIDELFAD